MAQQIVRARQLDITFVDEELRYGPIHRPVVTAFNEPDAEGLSLGAMSLRTHLESRKQGWVVKMSEFLRELPLSALIDSYSCRAGQPPLHPRLMLGLILYGFINNKQSLRELEDLAALDVGAMYLAAGLTPDHSTIGRFLVRHADALTQSFFEELTRQLLRKLGRQMPGAAAMDGTVVEAVASRFKVAKAEAVQQAAAEARATAAGTPDDDKLEKKAAQAEAAAAVATERQGVRRARHLKGETRIAVTEPDAVVQPLKSGAYRPSYKPSLITTKDRLIVAAHVHASNESTSVAPMLAQYETIIGEPPTTLMGDAGYDSAALLSDCVARNLNVLIPSTRENDDDTSHHEKYPKDRFTYDAHRDVYVCPQKKLLQLEAIHDGKDPYRRYRCHECAECPVRDKCTTSKGGRVVQRRPTDELREAMREVLKHPVARAQYRQRKEMVEPVFAVLRGCQGLNRFLRRGLKGVRLEFAVHCMAYNLRTAMQKVLAVLLWCVRAILAMTRVPPRIPAFVRLLQIAA